MGSEVQRTQHVDGDLGIEPKPIETNRSDLLAVLIEDGKLQGMIFSQLLCLVTQAVCARRSGNKMDVQES